MWKCITERVKSLADSSVVFVSAKICIVGFNILQISFTCWLLYSGLSMISEQVDTEEDPKKREMLEVNKTVLVISSIMASGLCLVGLIGAIRESYGCTCGYGVVLAVLLVVTLISPARARLLNLSIIVAMTFVALGYALILKTRENKADRAAANIYLASP